MLNNGYTLPVLQCTDGYIKIIYLVYPNKRNIPYLTDEIAAEAAARLDAEDDIPVKVEELVDTELVLPEVHVAPLLIEAEVNDYKIIFLKITDLIFLHNILIFL